MNNCKKMLNSYSLALFKKQLYKLNKGDRIYFKV